MARKDIFTSITSAAAATPERRATPGYATRGASRSMVSSLSELAEKAALADQALNGEKVVELEPDLLDASFVIDRMGEDEAAFEELLEAIRERGQDTPILVRPHPAVKERFQIVFGHRRVHAAKLLQRRVKAVVKTVSDIDHVIAQGQENSARQNLSFIERASFAQNLTELGHERRVVQASLSIDAPMLTRMLSVTGRVPKDIVARIGAAKGIGRDRWTEFAQQIEHPNNLALARQVVFEGWFGELSSEARFEFLASEMKKAKRSAKRSAVAGEWAAQDASVSAEFKASGKTYSISLKSKDAARFGRFIAENLERLHEEFATTLNSQGD